MFKRLTMLMVITALMAVSVNAFAAKKMQFIITSPDSQTQMMAMVLSMQSKKKGAELEIVLCGPGGDLALKGSKETIFMPPKKSPQMILKGLIKQGVKVEVCPLYLPAKGLNKDALIDGVTGAKPPVVAGEMVKDTTEVVTF